MPRDHNPTKTFRQMAKEKGYDKDWVSRKDEQVERAEYLAQVRRTVAAGGKHRTIEDYVKAKEGSAAKKLARLHQLHQKQKDEFSASIPGDAAHGFFEMRSPPPSPPRTPQLGANPSLKRTVTPLKLTSTPTKTVNKGKKAKRKTKSTTRSQSKKQKAIAQAILVPDSDEEGDVLRPPGGGSGGPPKPPHGGYPTDPVQGKKKKKKKKKVDVIALHDTDSDTPEEKQPTALDSSVPHPSSGVPGLMDDEKDDSGIPKAKKPSGAMMGLVKLFTERQLKRVINNPSIAAQVFASRHVTDKNQQLRAIQLMKKRHKQLEATRNHGHTVQKPGVYQGIVEKKTNIELTAFIKNPDEDIPDAHLPGLIAAAKQELKKRGPKAIHTQRSTGPIRLPTTRVEPAKKKPVKIKYKMPQHRAMQKFKKARKKLDKKTKREMKKRLKPHTVQGVEWRQQIAAAADITEQLRSKKKVKPKQKSRGFTQGGIKEAKLQIRQKGAGSYSVRATGMTPKVQTHIKLLLNRLSGNLVLDGKKMSKQQAFSYLVKQLTDHKTVQVQIVQ